MAYYLRPGSKVWLGFQHTGTVRKVLVNPTRIGGNPVPASIGHAKYLIKDDRDGHLVARDGGSLNRA